MDENDSLLKKEEEEVEEEKKIKDKKNFCWEMQPESV